MWDTIKGFLIVYPGITNAFVGADSMVEFVEDKVIFAPSCMSFTDFLFVGEEVMLGEVGVHSCGEEVGE